MNFERLLRDLAFISKFGALYMILGAGHLLWNWYEGGMPRADDWWLLLIGFLMFRYRPIGQSWQWWE